VKYADDCAWGKEKTVLQSMIYRLIENGKCYGMDVNAEK
jgi:hypothetical protein